MGSNIKIFSDAMKEISTSQDSFCETTKEVLICGQVTGLGQCAAIPSRALLCYVDRNHKLVDAALLAPLDFESQYLSAISVKALDSRSPSVTDGLYNCQMKQLITTGQHWLLLPMPDTTTSQCWLSPYWSLLMVSPDFYGHSLEFFRAISLYYLHLQLFSNSTM